MQHFSGQREFEDSAVKPCRYLSDKLSKCMVWFSYTSSLVGSDRNKADWAVYVLLSLSA